MFTTVDKAIAAILGGALTIAAQYGVDIDPELVQAFGSAVTVFLVWLIPNKPAT